MTQTELPKAILVKKASLPEKPSSIHLKGQYVWLEPLVIERDAQRLFEMSNGNALQLGERFINAYDADELIWRYMVDGPFKSVYEFSVFLQSQVNALNGRCMCVFDTFSGSQIGVTNLMNNFPTHLKIELGCIWFSPIAQRTAANIESAYLMLKHCFELGYRRVEWKCHSLNERSRKAALRIGFKFEGIHESHMIVKNRNRDTSWFRILDHEWPNAKDKLEKLLYHR